MGKKLHLVQHHDDEGLDEIQILVQGEPFLRCVMVPRYKTSGLSGDEWRVSAMWKKRDGGLWTPFDGPYSSIEAAAAAIYPGVFGSHPGWHALPNTAARFLRKGRHIIDMTHDGNTLPLLPALGHLPWALRIWPQMEHGLSVPFGGEATPDLCFQVGCREIAVSTYGLKKRFDRRGTARSAFSEWNGRETTWRA